MKLTSKYLLLSTFVAAIISFCACTPIENDNVENSVTLSAGSTVTATTASQFLIITSSESWNIEIDYLPETTDTKEAERWCTLSQTTGTGNASVVMSFGRNTSPLARSLKITVTFASTQVRELDFSQRGASAVVSDIHPMWLELPASATDDNHQFVTHYLPAADGGGRSFSILYDTEHYIPTWVAYTLHTTNVGTGSRTNDWGFDPIIPVADQVNLFRSYAGSYDRGHMLPSASRLTSDDANGQTFYYTNMTPQLSSLNQKGWATIEGQVRGWKGTRSDTLYVVTGAVIRTVGGNEPIDNISAYNGTFSTKPNYYYKALLKLSQRNDLKSYEAMAIWVDHKSRSGGATANDVITIDELERRTGIDFFPNLEKTTQEAVESSWNPSAWGL